MDEPQEELIDALWARVLDDWETSSVHDAFITASAEAGELGAAAGRYRAQMESADRAALAEKKLESVTFLALQALEVDKTPPSKSAPRWVVITAVVVTALALALLAYSLLQ